MARRWLTVVVVCLASAGAGVTALASLRLDRELSVGRCASSATRPPGSARPLRPAGRLGRALWWRAGARATARRRGARRPRRRGLGGARGRGLAARHRWRQARRAQRDRVLPADPRRGRVRLRPGFGLLVALSLRGAGLPLLPGAIAAGDGARAGRRDHRPAAAARRPRNAEYYARRPGHPARAARGRVAEASATCSTEELDGQIVGLARLVTAPADRTTLGGRPRITVASDLHDDLLAVPALQRVARGTPLFFVGDLTDRGTPFEAQLTSGSSTPARGWCS